MVSIVRSQGPWNSEPSPVGRAVWPDGVPRSRARQPDRRKGPNETTADWDKLQAGAAIGVKVPVIVTIPAEHVSRAQSKLFNQDFLRAHHFPVPAWLERKSKIGVPVEVRQDS